MGGLEGIGRNRAGYTLIELLLYIVVIGSLLTAITYFFGTMTTARVKNQTIAEVNDQGAAVLDYMARTIRNATSVTSPAAGANGSSLTLVVPSAPLSPTVFSLSGTTLQVKEGAAANIPLTSGDVQVSGLAFRNLTRPGTPGIVQVSLTVNRSNPNNRNEYDYQKTFTTSAEVAW